jgi:hypothetical protein
MSGSSAFPEKVRIESFALAGLISEAAPMRAAAPVTFPKKSRLFADFMLAIVKKFLVVRSRHYLICRKANLNFPGGFLLEKSDKIQTWKIFSKSVFSEK